MRETVVIAHTTDTEVDDLIVLLEELGAKEGKDEEGFGYGRLGLPVRDQSYYDVLWARLRGDHLVTLLTSPRLEDLNFSWEGTVSVFDPETRDSRHYFVSPGSREADAWDDVVLLYTGKADASAQKGAAFSGHLGTLVKVDDLAKEEV